MSDLFGDRDRQRQITMFLLKILGVAVGIGLVIGLGSAIMVKSLGLNAVETTNLGGDPIAPVTPLPTTAVPVPTPTDLPLPTQDTVAPPTAADTGGLYLTASPLYVDPMERVNLTGQWPGHDAVGLMVQRYEGGAWVDFGVQVEVQVGTFATYVISNQVGENRFRVYDPNTNTASNAVSVSIGQSQPQFTPSP